MASLESNPNNFHPHLAPTQVKPAMSNLHPSPATTTPLLSSSLAIAVPPSLPSPSILTCSPASSLGLDLDLSLPTGSPFKKARLQTKQIELLPTIETIEGRKFNDTNARIASFASSTTPPLLTTNIPSTNTSDTALASGVLSPLSMELDTLTQSFATACRCAECCHLNVDRIQRHLRERPLDGFTGTHSDPSVPSSTPFSSSSCKCIPLPSTATTSSASTMKGNKRRLHSPPPPPLANDHSTIAATAVSAVSFSTNVASTTSVNKPMRSIVKVRKSGGRPSSLMLRPSTHSPSSSLDVEASDNSPSPSPELTHDDDEDEDEDDHDHDYDTAHQRDDDTPSHRFHDTGSSSFNFLHSSSLPLHLCSSTASTRSITPSTSDGFSNHVDSSFNKLAMSSINPSTKSFSKAHPSSSYYGYDYDHQDHTRTNPNGDGAMDDEIVSGPACYDMDTVDPALLAELDLIESEENESELNFLMNKMNSSQHQDSMPYIL